MTAFGCATWAQQTQPQNTESSVPVIRTETRLVLVDTVVTDKKGNYIGDLTQKDFRVWEDNKEQPIKTFSVESEATANNPDRRHYLVLFFDNSTMQLSDQARARDAAFKFLDANTGADRYIAIADFTGVLRISQNFTTDAARLKQVVRDLKISSVGSPGVTAGNTGLALGGVPQFTSAEANFGAQTMLLALREMAKALASVPGRKTVVLLSAGFPMNPADPATSELESELTAAIDACNKANVAVYPIDVRGLVAPFSGPPTSQLFRDSSSGRLISATLDLDADAPARLVYVQHGGTGGGGVGGGGVGGGGHSGGTGGTGLGGGHSGTGTGTGGGHTGSTGGTRGTGGSPSLAPVAPYSQAHSLIPEIPNIAATQMLLYELAAGTGGFVIVNSNDLLGALQKISQEQNRYYILGYTPPASDEGTCHTLRVKVDRGDTIVRARSGYCNVRSTDLLAGKPVEKQLEGQVAGSQPGNVAASMQAPYFYTSADVARVNLAIDIPPNSIKFEKQKGKQHAEINVLAMAYKPDGSVAARSSDNVEFNFDKKEEIEAFEKQPYHYTNQFEIAPGHYDLKVAFSSGGTNFGKLQLALVVDSYDAKQLTMSTVAMSKEVRPFNQMTASLDAALLEDRKPLVAQGMEIVPGGSDRFKKTEPAVIYVEIYDPLLTDANPPKLAVQMRVRDRKTGEQKVDAGGAVPNVQAGNPVVPLGLRLPLDKLQPGSYQLELKAQDTAGHATPVRTTDFEVE